MGRTKSSETISIVNGTAKTKRILRGNFGWRSGYTLVLSLLRGCSVESIYSMPVPREQGVWTLLLGPFCVAAVAVLPIIFRAVWGRVQPDRLNVKYVGHTEVGLTLLCGRPGGRVSLLIPGIPHLTLGQAFRSRVYLGRHVRQPLSV